MLYMLLMTLSLSLALTIPLTTTPLTLGVWILSMAISYSLLISMISSTWFGLILFIIYISGMLVMFSYFAAISPNQQMPISNMFYSLTITIFLAMVYLFNKNILPSSMSLLSAKYTSPCSLFLYSAHQIPTLLILAILLLLMLILVVKIVEHKKGPLRPFM